MPTQIRSIDEYLDLLENQVVISKLIWELNWNRCIFNLGMIWDRLEIHQVSHWDWAGVLVEMWQLLSPQARFVTHVSTLCTELGATLGPRADPMFEVLWGVFGRLPSNMGAICGRS